MTVLDAATTPTGEVPHSSSDGKGWRSYANELRPSVATGGMPAFPIMVLFLLNAADELDRVAFAVLLPEIKNYFGASLTAIVTIQSLAQTFILLAALPIGYLSDRRRRTRMLGIGAGAWGVFSILTAFATNLFSLGFFRFGSGAAKSLDPAQQSLIADYYPPDRRAGVFAVHRLGNSVGQFVGPILAGVLASLFFWQASFLVFGFVGFAVALITLLKLREPTRGGLERQAMGLDADAEQPPPSVTESWRTAKSVRSLRRIWYSIPFLIGSLAAIAPLQAIYFDEEFGLSAAERGFVAAFNEPFQVVGLLVGAAVSGRLLRDRPGRVITYAGLLAVVMGLTFVVIALSPILAVAVAMGWAFSFGAGILAPAVPALMSMVIPARARGFGLSVAAIVIIPGVLVGPLAASLGDRYGIRTGILLLTPVFIVGALIFASAGATVEGDIRAAAAAAAAQLVAQDEDSDTLLVIRDLDVHYGQVQILFNVDLEIERGEILALLGTNGAGKSTVLNAVAGVTAPSNGAIVYAAEDITYLPDNEHIERGIVMVPGGKGIFPTLTVAENLRLATWGRKDTTAVEAAMNQVLDFFPILRSRSSEAAGNLSGGEQQMLALGQAFLNRPTLLMIDELSLGLAPAIVEQLLELVRAMNEAGTTIVLVEQSVNVALTVADRAVFMERGQIRFSGPTQELMQRTDILRSVFLAGSQAAVGGVALARDERDLGHAEPILELHGVSKSFGGVSALTKVDLKLREGEILGIIGPNGAGKTTLFDVISGFHEPDEGQILLVGEDVTDRSADERARMGLTRSFQDAKLFPALTVSETLAVALDQRMDTTSALLAAVRAPNVANAERRAKRRVDRLIDLIGLGDYRDKFLRELSTGTRRLVDIACVLGTDPQVLLLDEPSSGVAQRETEELGPLLQRIKTETGCSIVIIEHDMPLITSVSDELVAMILGTPVLRGEPNAVLDHPTIVEAYLGSDAATIFRSGTRN